MTTGKLYRIPASGGLPVELIDEDDFCVVDSGEAAGTILFSARAGLDPESGVKHACSVMAPSGEIRESLADCDHFHRFVADWSRKNNTRCQ